MSVFVAGSLHLDVIVAAPHLPRLDETVTGQDVAYAFGGKGGNQAVAAARMGAQVAMAGAVGTDAFGDRLLADLARGGVDAGQVARIAGPSGMSVAITEPGGGYGAVIVSAANLAIAADAVTIPADARLLILQNEIPEAVNLALAARARIAGVKVVLNAAPARPMDPALLPLVDLLVVNAVEAADILGTTDAALDPVQAVQALALRGPAAVIVTLGARGLALWDGDAAHVPGHAITPVSSHGAGDAFIGALAARLAAGDALGPACAFAQGAAALHVASPVALRHQITPQSVAAFVADRPA
jgi:ribokinase